LPLFFYGLRFDASAIFYINALFIVLSILPILKASYPKYQAFLKYLYFITNFSFIALNFIDLIYYRFTYVRSGISMLESIENEGNKLIQTINRLYMNGEVLNTKTFQAVMRKLFGNGFRSKMKEFVIIED
jgi:hypothetical protein